MKFHKVEMVGRFILQKLSSLPIFSPTRDEGRLVYDDTKKKVYLGTDTDWTLLGSGNWGDLDYSFTDGDVLDPGNLYSIDTTTQPLTGYLNTSPTSGDTVSFYDTEGTFSLNPFTLSGDTNTINGYGEIDFTLDHSIVSLLYNGSEWKVDIGGLNTGSAGASGSLNFNSIDGISSIENLDNLVVEDQTDGKNKKISIENLIKTFNVDGLDELTSSDNDYLIIYDVDGNEVKKITSGNIVSSTGINFLYFYPSNMSLDDTDTGSDFGDVFEMYECVNFQTSEDGSIWITGRFPSSWSSSSNLNLSIEYSLNGNDPNKNVNITTDFWSIINNEIPDSNTPDISISNTLTSDTNNIGKYSETTLNSIDSSNLESGIQSFVLRIKRDVSEDTYGGTLQLISLKINQ